MVATKRGGYQENCLPVANAARRWSAVKDGWYQSIHHLAMVATKRGGYEERLAKKNG
jgi:hypothetical protein